MQYDFFLSHYQSTGGDQVMTLELRLSAMGFHCWLDQNAATITKESMKVGVKDSKVLVKYVSRIACTKVFLLFLSQGVLTRPFCLFEIQTAMGEQKALMLMHETDAVSFPAYSLLPLPRRLFYLVTFFYVFLLSRRQCVSF